ncbi:MAG: sigma-54-dependent Fis family transcriptional regulator [Candidatus Cloacimonetes bacterium]|nr:sigma-54-dependent Fis family transcriptional regulator [Candidatus Cloacimonadota bacterium]
MHTLKTLILDDETSITNKLHRYLTRKKFAVFCANTPQEAFQVLIKNKIDIVLCDILLPEMNGIEVLKRIKSTNPEIEVIMISGHGDMDTVIQAIRLGAVDFIRKPFSGLDAQLAIERTGKYIKLQNRIQSVENLNSLISRELENLIDQECIGTSEAIQEVLDLTLKAAKDRDINVLITGENGTGKEIIARIIHFASVRKEHPFFPVNSSAIPETLLESEFFGHRKGAFTGATENKKGCFELAHGGSLFLDEIADMPYSLQAKLLRAIEEKKIKQVGSNDEVPVDVRIISATNKKIKNLVKDNKFRLDLYHRINTFIIDVPPLRERKDDIEPLLIHFINFFSKKKKKNVPQISKNLINKLKKYKFPGNVRELKNMVERALILANGGILSEEYFPLVDHTLEPVKAKSKESYNFEQNEINLIKETLKITNNSKVKAAQLLGIPRYTLVRKMKKFNIE